VGCAAGPSYRGDTEYRAIEREANRNSAELAVTGAAIAADTERIAGHAARVVSELDGLEAAIGGSSLAEAEKEPLLLRAEATQAEAAALAVEAAALRKDAALLNDQLAKEREINAALSAEHDRREAAVAAVQEELEGVKGQLATVKQQRNLCFALLLAALGWVVFRLLRVVPG
jgi:chromosome segregation ATPase